jgi:hypothetical protein
MTARGRTLPTRTAKMPVSSYHTVPVQHRAREGAREELASATQIARGVMQHRRAPRERTLERSMDRRRERRHREQHRHILSLPGVPLRGSIGCTQQQRGGDERRDVRDVAEPRGAVDHRSEEAAIECPNSRALGRPDPAVAAEEEVQLAQLLHEQHGGEHQHGPMQRVGGWLGVRHGRP